MSGMCPTPRDCRRGEPCMIATGCDNDPRLRPRWDHATLDEFVRRCNTFTQSWHEVIADMRAETGDQP